MQGRARLPIGPGQPSEQYEHGRDQDGPYAITVGIMTPSGRGGIDPLARHPRKRDVWGLDTVSIDPAGAYSFRFSVDGPQGHGEGTLRGVEVLSQPGPPLALSWTVAVLPLVALVALIVVAWRRVRPGRRPLLA